MSAESVLVPLGFFTMVSVTAIGVPLARAYARRIDARISGGTGSGSSVQMPADLTSRMERIEHAIDSIALEVERISEGQRFTTRLLSERSAQRDGESQNAGVPAGGSRG